MRRGIYSLYIDIPKERLDDQPAYRGDTISKSERTKYALRDNYDKLYDTKVRYADVCNATFEMFEYDQQWLNYYERMKQDHPYFTDYHIINFYKLHLLEKMSNRYDEVLYLDFDVVPTTDECFFDVWDLDKGIAIANNNEHVKKRFNQVGDCNRSPTAKWLNSMAMLMADGPGAQNDVYNTGIIGAKKEHVKQLDYFGKFDEDIQHMTDLQVPGASGFPPHVEKIFGYDNETLFSYKVVTSGVPIQWLDEKWHFFMDNEYIFKDVKFVHAINKNFGQIWRYCETNNIQYL